MFGRDDGQITASSDPKTLPLRFRPEKEGDAKTDQTDRCPDHHRNAKSHVVADRDIGQDRCDQVTEDRALMVTEADRRRALRPGSARTIDAA